MDVKTARAEHDELLWHIIGISSILSDLENAVELFAARHGDLNQKVECAGAFQSAVADLKREMLRQYLDFRITTAEPAVNNVR